MNGVAFDPDARAEFLAAVEYYEECEAELGRRFRQLVETEINNINVMPFRFRVLHAPFRRCLIPKFPYYVIFSIEPSSARAPAKKTGQALRIVVQPGA